MAAWGDEDDDEEQLPTRTEVLDEATGLKALLGVCRKKDLKHARPEKRRRTCVNNKTYPKQTLASRGPSCVSGGACGDKKVSFLKRRALWWFRICNTCVCARRR